MAKRKKSKRKSNDDGGTTVIPTSSSLKTLRGTAESTPLPPEWTESRVPCLEPKDGNLFDDCRKVAYQGFEIEGPDSMDKEFHNRFEKCFADLEGLYMYDAIQPGGQRVSKTSVQRTLIGDPGSTYRYLGLRLFSHPWCGVNKDGDRTSSSPVPLPYTDEQLYALLEMGRLSDMIKKRTQQQLDKLPTSYPKGSCDFTLSLVNRMQPSSEKKDLKRDSILKKKTSVSWHKDSGLQDFSSIAVYHSVEESREGSLTDDGRKPTQWKIALRVASKECQTPALMVPMPSGTMYYLLDDFNHVHEHAVMSGALGLRYSSTLRVARGLTWQTIRDRMRSLPSTSPVSIKQVRAQQLLYDELEFEWLRQWYVQGKQHASLHPYWHQPISEMIESMTKIQSSNANLMKLIKSDSLPLTLDKNALLDCLIEASTKRLSSLLKWEERLTDPLYDTLPQDCQPFSDERMSIETASDTQQTLKRLRKWKQKANAGSSKTKNEKRKQGSSNWEAFQKQSGYVKKSKSTNR